MYSNHSSSSRIRLVSRIHKFCPTFLKGILVVSVLFLAFTLDHMPPMRTLISIQKYLHVFMAYVAVPLCHVLFQKIHSLASNIGRHTCFKTQPCFLLHFVLVFHSSCICPHLSRIAGWNSSHPSHCVSRILFVDEISTLSTKFEMEFLQPNSYFIHIFIH